jgi:hypothetical protein
LTLAYAAETGCEQRVALRDHMVEGDPTIGSDYVVSCGESAAMAADMPTLLGTGGGCLLLERFFEIACLGPRLVE